MKKTIGLFLLLGIGGLLIAGCGGISNLEYQENLPDLTFEQMSDIAKAKAKKWHKKISNHEIPMKDGYYQLSVAEQKEYFFLQNETMNKAFFLPGVSFMDIEFMTGEFCIISEGESRFPLSYYGNLEVFGKHVRYPIEMKLKFFKNFHLQGKVKRGSVDITFEIPRYKEDRENYDKQVKVYHYQEGESFSIDPWQDEIAPLDPSIEKYDIYFTSHQDDSSVDYEIVFQDNSR